LGGRGQIAVPSLLKLAPVVTLRRLAADPNGVRNYLEPLEAFGELVLGNGFAALAVLGPRSAFYGDQSFADFLR